jgi:hypothetical protein
MAQVGKKVRFNSLRNLLVAQLTADTSAATTFGTAIGLGVESELTWSPQIVTEDLRGARGLQESDVYVDFCNWALKNGELDLDVVAMAFGGAAVEVAESGVGAGDSKSMFWLEQGLRAGYFGIIGQPVTVAGGVADYYVCLLKCQVSNFNPGRMGGGWAQVEMSGRAMYTNKDGVLFGIVTCEKREDGTFTIALADLADFLA